MNAENKRRNTMEDLMNPKRVKKECSYGESCYRRNPAHFREYSHAHLESILDSHSGVSGSGEFPIPLRLQLQRHTIQEQLEVIVEKQLYLPKRNDYASTSTQSTEQEDATQEVNTQNNTKDKNKSSENIPRVSSSSDRNRTSNVGTNASNVATSISNVATSSSNVGSGNNNDSIRSSDIAGSSNASASSTIDSSRSSSDNVKTNVDSERKKEHSVTPKEKDKDYRPIIPPTRMLEYIDFSLKGKMRAKHKASEPYNIFYTRITDAKETHTQPYTITFQEILDESLGELKCSLQINFMVELGWLLAQYYFAGYSAKKLTILYGEDSEDLRTITKKKPHVDAHHVRMATPFGKHHTKMMILCYENGSIRVVVSTANLYLDDWENRTQGLWLSPECPELPPDAMPYDGESPTFFKRTLLRYLNHYHMPQIAYYIDRVKRCDFSHIRVFLTASVPGSHMDQSWGMSLVGSLLRQHCMIGQAEQAQYSLVAQASSLGSYGKQPQLWLTGDFLHNFTKIKDQPQMMTRSPELRLIYPSLENVKQSHDGLLGGGCLPYGGDAHAKQTWLEKYLYQWKATSTHRNKAMPHIKCYTRVSPDCTRAAYFLLTSANVSKAAWGTLNKGNAALRLMSYEAGVLLLPRILINEDFFPINSTSPNNLIIPYDLPPTKYTEGMTPWVQDYLFK